MDKIKFAKVKENAIIPSKSIENAGYDIYGLFGANDDKNRIVPAHTTKLIPTGIACALPSKYYFQVEERGSTGSKGIKKSAGVIDSGYRGEIFIAITNSTDKCIVFADKEKYLAEIDKECEERKGAKFDSLSEEEKEHFRKAVKDNLPTDINYSNDSIEAMAKTIMETTYSEETFNMAKELINSAIFYPDTKAIAQLVLHEVPVVEIEEISYEELQAIPSERGTGSLGSSNK